MLVRVLVFSVVYQAIGRLDCMLKRFVMFIRFGCLLMNLECKMKYLSQIEKNRTFRSELVSGQAGRQAGI